VAGKGSVRYIIDGILMELDASAMAMRLQNLHAEDIEKIELLTAPPSRYASEPNAVYISISSQGTNLTDYGAYTSSSQSLTESKPNNSLTLTGFYDWTFGAKGETIQLTYNFFNRHSPALSHIKTIYSDSADEYCVNEDGETDYRFHSGKADFRLPYKWAQLETGVAYTYITNSSDNLLMQSFMNGVAPERESNIFEYSERIAAAYITASRNLGAGFWGKVGLRYEYTSTKGTQLSMGSVNRDKYGHLFPTFNLSWNRNRIGSFNISYSMGMGRPNLWELNPFKYYSTTDEYAAGNPALKPTLYNNAEINYYGLGRLYAVLYTSFASDAIGYIRRFDDDGVLSTQPYNCLSTNKTGLYASYKHTLFGRWELKAGGEVFHSSSHSDVHDYKISNMEDWSGKLEISTNIMLNRPKTLIFEAQFSHFFPWQQNLIKYESFQLFNLSLRYSLLNNRLRLQLRANDIFGWNKTKSKEHYTNYSIRHTFDSHSSYVLFGITYRFGRDKVNGVWRASKEDQSGRTK